MERITLYHRGMPITHHELNDSSFSIGSDPTCDLVLAGTGISERHLVLYQGNDKGWLARFEDAPKDQSTGLRLRLGTRLPLGPYTVEVSLLSQGTCKKTASRHRTVSGINTEFVGQSASLNLLRREIHKLAPLKGPVLIQGETGTGKELIARSLHEQSRRSDGPLIAVNCGSLTPALLADTFFGHNTGAFTGAARNRRGVFEQASGGTLFLDEIGELPLSEQASLLRVLENGEINRLGSERCTKVDIRIIAATNLNLLQLVNSNKFRLDLYHRLATLQLTTTPLQNRPEDVGPLALHFLELIKDEVGARTITPDAIQQLCKYDWPGNVRELKNVIYRSAALTERPELSANDIQLPAPVCPSETQPGAGPPSKDALSQLTDGQLEEILGEHGYNVSATSEFLCIPRSTLRDLLIRRKLKPLKFRRKPLPSPLDHLDS